MQKSLAHLLVLASMLASAPAHAATSASITINGTTRTLSQSGFLFEQVGGSATMLQPGDSRDFRFDYSISLQDSGLAVAFDPKASGCSSIFPTTCGDTYTGFEYAKAYLIVFQEDPRNTHNPAVIEEGVGGHVTLATHGDAFAESLTQSGTLEAHIRNENVPGAAPYSHLYPTYLALWVLANPIPEPPVVALMVAGLLAIGGMARARVVMPSATALS